MSSYIFRMLAATSGSLAVLGSSLVTTPGEMIVVRML